MIELTNLAKQKIWINQDLIKMLETAPDTILCFVDGSRLPVRETPAEIRQKILQLRQEQNQVRSFFQDKSQGLNLDLRPESQSMVGE